MSQKSIVIILEATRRAQLIMSSEKSTNSVLILYMNQKYFFHFYTSDISKSNEWVINCVQANLILARQHTERAVRRCFTK